MTIMIMMMMMMPIMKMMMMIPMMMLMLRSSTLRVARHSRNDEKKGWDEISTTEVSDWFPRLSDYQTIRL